jgi:hypothetical protein
MRPVLWQAIKIPEPFRTTARVGSREVTYGGDVRLGDLRNDGVADFLVYRSMGDAHDGGGMKPCFLGAFTAEGVPIWQVGRGGTQPSRPGPVAIHDLDGDGRTEVVCFFHDPHVEADPESMADVVIQVRDGRTGAVKHQAAPAAFRACRGHGPNWVHQRILIANFRGTAGPRDFVVKLGARVLAFNADLEILWTYESPWTAYGRCPAYIPAVGDIDGDGQDEVNGGYFLLDHDGTVLWERDLAPHMDSVIIARWDGGRMRAIGSGHGYVLDAEGRVVMKLGGARVPHGQEVRVGHFRRRGDGSPDPEPQMVIRNRGHDTRVLVVDTSGTVLKALELNPSPNHTGMAVVHWRGREGPDVLYNGGMLWDPVAGMGTALPRLPEPDPVGRMAWYHCIPADVCGDRREEVVLWNPWAAMIFVYTQAGNDLGAYGGYVAGPRQVNARLMD